MPRIKPHRSKAILFLIGLVISGFCLYFAFRKVNLNSFLLEFKKMNPMAIVLALVLVNLHNFLLAFRWKFLLSHLGKVPYWTAFWSLRLSFFFNASLPARLGEPFRVWYIHRMTKISPARAVGALGVDRFLDFVCLFALVYISALVLGMRGNLPATSTIVGATISVFALFFVLAKLPKHSKVGWLHWLLQLRSRIFEGIASLKSIRVMSSAIPISFLGWCIEASILVVFSYGLGDPFSIFRAFMVVAAVNVAISIPSSPGHIGTFQLGAMTMLLFLNVGKGQAATIAILYHLVQLIPTLLIGAFGYYFYFMRIPKISKTAKAHVLADLENQPTIWETPPVSEKRNAS